MIELRDLPAVNATLNSLSAGLLIAGYWFIRRRAINRHRWCMLGALGVSLLFLISYLIYHAHAGRTRFTGTGVIRNIYFVILGSHTILAVVIVPLALVTVFLAFRGRLVGHRRLARWTLPIWLYVSVTGVVIYFMLYHWYAP